MRIGAEAENGGAARCVDYTRVPEAKARDGNPGYRASSGCIGGGCVRQRGRAAVAELPVRIVAPASEITCVSKATVSLTALHMPQVKHVPTCVLAGARVSLARSDLHDTAQRSGCRRHHRHSSEAGGCRAVTQL